MEYNYSAIGERIRTLRKEWGLSQEKLIETLGDEYGVRIGRNTLSAIENGDKADFSFSLLTALSGVFGCDVGYIIGEYNDGRTLGWQYFHDLTGLSVDAIINLYRMQHPEKRDMMRIEERNMIRLKELELLNSMLEDKQFLWKVASHLLRIQEIPEYAFFRINYFDASKNLDEGVQDVTLSPLVHKWSYDDPFIVPLLMDSSSGTLKRLYIADLENIIFNFISGISLKENGGNSNGKHS